MILSQDVEQIEDRRPANQNMDALYILSPQPHIVDCLMADFEAKRYRKAWLVFTSCTSSPPPTESDLSLTPNV